MIDAAGKSVWAGFGQQAVVHPSFRNLQVIVRLTEEVWKAAQKRFDLLFAFPNDNFWKIYQRLMGWEKVDEFMADLAAVDQAQEVVKNMKFKRFEIKRLHEFSPGIDAWLNTDKKCAVFFRKTADFLNWRLFRHPVCYYFVMGAYDAGRLVGYMALKLYWDGSQTVGHFIDYAAKGGDEDCIWSLVEAALSFFKMSRVKNIIFWNRQTEYIGAFNRLELQRRSFKTNFGVKFLSEGMKRKRGDLLDIDKWSFSMAFSDAF